jgi:hypothetical protein
MKKFITHIGMDTDSRGFDIAIAETKSPRSGRQRLIVRKLLLRAVARSVRSVFLPSLSWGSAPLHPRAGSPAEHLGWGARLYAFTRCAGFRNWDRARSGLLNHFSANPPERDPFRWPLPLFCLIVKPMFYSILEII